jgi:hypothetical protein
MPTAEGGPARCPTVAAATGPEGSPHQASSQMGASSMPWANISAVGPRDWIAWGWAPYLCRLKDGWEWSEASAAVGVSLPLPGGLQGTCSVLASEHACALHRVELVRGSAGLSVASRPLCLPPPVPPDIPDAPGAPADSEPPPAPPELTAPQHHSAPGPAWITSVPSRPAAA